MTFQNENVARTILDVLRLSDKLALGLAKYLLNADRARRVGNEDAYQNQLANIRELLCIPLDVSSDLEATEERL